MFVNLFFEICRKKLCHPHTIVVITSIVLSQEIFAIDILTALKSSLKHRRKHVLRWLRLYGDQDLVWLVLILLALFSYSKALNFARACN